MLKYSWFVESEIWLRNFLAVQWLGLSAFTAMGLGLIPGQGTKIPQAVWCSQKKKKGNVTKLTNLTLDELSISKLRELKIKWFQQSQWQILNCHVCVCFNLCLWKAWETVTSYFFSFGIGAVQLCTPLLLPRNRQIYEHNEAALFMDHNSCLKKQLTGRPWWVRSEYLSDILLKTNVMNLFLQWE